MRRTVATFALALLAGGTAWSTAHAAEYEVQMRSKDSRNQMWQFEPAFLKIAPGDTVTFVPTDKGHNSEATDKTIPQGAVPWKGKINEPIRITYDQEGVYLYKCLPHATLGMVGIIQVGDSTANVDLVKSANIAGKGKARLAELIKQVAN
jgi:pseudoazurin